MTSGAVLCVCVRVSRGFPVQRCIVLKHLSKEAEEDPGSPPAKRSCPDLQVNPEPDGQSSALSQSIVQSVCPSVGQDSSEAAD